MYSIIKRLALKLQPDKVWNRHQHDTHDDENRRTRYEIRNDHEENTAHERHRSTLILAVQEESKANTAEDQAKDDERRAHVSPRA